MAKIRCLMLLLLVGCSSSIESKPMDVESFIGSVNDKASAIALQQDEILKAVKEQDHSIKAVWTKLEALDLTLATLKPQTGKDGDPQSSPSPPESPAKANTQTPFQVATPGTSQESLVELASRLYASGVNVHNRTEGELKAIDAQMHGVKSLPVQYQSRPTYSVQSGCPGGVCPTQRRGLFGRRR